MDRYQAVDNDQLFVSDLEKSQQVLSVWHLFPIIVNYILSLILKAPGNGLVLRQVHYDQYNKDYGEQKGALEWTDEQVSLDAFAKEKILPQIFELDIGKSIYLSGG